MERSKLELHKYKTEDRHVALLVSLMNLRPADLRNVSLCQAFGKFLDWNGLYQGPHVDVESEVAFAVGASIIAREVYNYATRDL